MVVEDATAGEEAIMLSVVHRSLVSKDLGDAIEIAWLERRSFTLWTDGDRPEHLAAGRLVEPGPRAC